MILETAAESQFRGLACCFFVQLLSSRLPFRAGAATSSSSSSPSSSSITAAVMLALAEPPLPGAPQNGVSVECRWRRAGQALCTSGSGPRLFILHSGTNKSDKHYFIFKIVSWQADLALKCTFFMKKKYNGLLFLKQ